MTTPPSSEKEVISVEPATPEDAAGIAHVRKATWLATYPNPTYGVTEDDILAKQFDSDDQIQRWRKALEDQEGPRKLWVAKDRNGTVVGYGQGKKGVDQNEIWGLYVLPTHQGQGLGRRLMQCVIDWLGNEKPIHLSVAIYSHSAIALYKKFGFEQGGQDPSSPSFASGATIPSLSMIRPKR